MNQIDLEIEYLKNDGIEFFNEQLNKSQAFEQGYESVPAEMYSALDDLFALAPQYVTSKMTIDAARKSFENGVRDTYRVKLDPGVHLTKSHQVEGAFSANTRDAKGARGPAVLLQNDYSFSVSKNPQIIQNAFNIMSVTTGQYFMAEINEKLADLRRDIDGIRRAMEIDKCSEFQAALSSMQDIIDHAVFSHKNQERRIADLMAIRNLKQTAEKFIDWCNSEITTILVMKNVKKDDSNAISLTINSVTYYTRMYKLAVNLYTTCIAMDIYMADITDAYEIEKYKSQIEQIIHEYAQCVDSYEKQLRTYIDNASGMKKLSRSQRLRVLLNFAPDVLGTLMKTPFIDNECSRKLPNAYAIRALRALFFVLPPRFWC